MFLKKIMEKKLVSVIIPTYKRSNTLVRSINSVLNQSYNLLEVLVVDDNNPDTEARRETENVMLNFKDNSKVYYIKHEFNKNGSAARNTGFRYSKGDYIMFLDDDDEFFPHKVKSQVDCLESKDESWGACYTKIEYKKNGKTIMKSAECREGDLLVDALGRNLFIAAGSNLMIRRNVIDAINGFNESFQRNQDLEFLVRILKKWKLAFVDEYGLIVFMHPPVKMKHSFDELTVQFLKLFEKEIGELNTHDRNTVFRLINLQRIRARLFKEKDCKKVTDMILKKEVNVFDFIRFIYYLSYRIITRKSMGFKI